MLVWYVNTAAILTGDVILFSMHVAQEENSVMWYQIANSSIHILTLCCSYVYGIAIYQS